VGRRKGFGAGADHDVPILVEAGGYDAEWRAVPDVQWMPLLLAVKQWQLRQHTVLLRYQMQPPRETFRCLLLPYLLRMWHQQQMQQSLKILRGSAPPRLNFVPDKTGDRSVS
jgi:hypothetical protein